MTTFSDIPQELIDCIIAELAQLFDSTIPLEQKAKQTTLRSCCRTSKSFHHRSRQLLFEDLTITIDPRYVESKAAKALREIFEKDPNVNLANYVKSFTVNLGLQVEELIYGATPICDSNLPILLGMFHNLKYLALTAIGDCCEWQNTSEEIKTALLFLRDYSTVETLSLSGPELDLPVEFLYGWPHMKNLIVQDSPVTPRGQLPVGHSSTTASLETLVLNTKYSRSIFHLLNNPNIMPIQGLRHITATVRDLGDWIALWGLLQANDGQQLESLSVMDIFAYTFHSIPTLETNQIDFQHLSLLVVRETNVICGVLVDIVDFVCIFSAFARLESIVIDLKWAPVVDKGIASEVLREVLNTENGWRKLDYTLTTSSILRRLEISLRFSLRGSNDDADSLVDKFEAGRHHWTPSEILPSLAARDSIAKVFIWEVEARNRS